MKKTLIIFAFMLGIVTISKAQNGQGGARNMGTPEERTQRMMTQLASKVMLTDDQKAKLTAIYVAQNKTLDSLRASANGDMKSVRPKMGEINKANNQKIMALFTDDQKKAYSTWMEERRSKAGQGGHKPAGGGNAAAGVNAPANDN